MWPRPRKLLSRLKLSLPLLLKPPSSPFLHKTLPQKADILPNTPRPLYMLGTSDGAWMVCGCGWGVGGVVRWGGGHNFTYNLNEREGRRARAAIQPAVAVVELQAVRGHGG